MLGYPKFFLFFLITHSFPFILKGWQHLNLLINTMNPLSCNMQKMTSAFGSTGSSSILLTKNCGDHAKFVTCMYTNFFQNQGIFPDRFSLKQSQ